MDDGRGPATLGERIRALRKKRRMTQEDLATAAGVRRSTIQNIESGRTNEPYSVDKIATALGVPVGHLLDGAPAGLDDREGAEDEVVIRVRTPKQREFAERLRDLVEQMDAEDAEEAARRALATPDEGPDTATG